MEIKDLYDNEKIKTGNTVLKGEEIPVGQYYITVVVCIQNQQGEFLLQRRVDNKDGKWAFTGGEPKSGQSSLEGIITEIKEELGIEVSPNHLALVKTIQTENHFVDLYYLKTNIDTKNLVLQEDEVDSVKWISPNQIIELIETNQVSTSHQEFYYKYLEFLKTIRLGDNLNRLKEEDVTEIVRRVKSLIINSNNEILLGYANNQYQFIGGRIEEGEEFATSLKREILEETGMEYETSKLVPFISRQSYYKDWPSPSINRRMEVFYYEIITDDIPNLEKTNYTDEEKESNFELKYIPLNIIEEELNEHVEIYGDEYSIIKEMLEVISYYKLEKR